MYKAIEESDKALAFIMENLKDLSIRTEQGVIIHVVEKDNGRLQIMIGVEEDTRSDDLREAIPNALDWRDRLMEWQGHQPTSTDKFFSELDRLHKEGASYNELAERINQKVADSLSSFHEYWQRRATVLSQIESELELLHWALNAGFDPFVLHHARVLLEACGLNEKEIEEQFIAGLENIDAGDKPFCAGHPVSGIKIRNKLRYWRDNKHQDP